MVNSSVSTDADCAGAVGQGAAYGSMNGELVPPTSGLLLLNFTTPAMGLVMCYRFGLEPWKLYSGIRFNITSITGLQSSNAVGRGDTAVAAVPKDMTFSGVGLQSGDKVKWVSASASDCEGSPVAGSSQGTLDAALSTTVQFATPINALLYRCHGA